MLQAKHITAERYEIESYTEHELASQSAMVRLWAAEGTAILMVNGKRYSLQPGDVLEVPPRSTVTITTGFSDFAWYQSR